MPLFFPSLCEIDRFSFSFDCLSQLTCAHCHRCDQWISHGYLYRLGGVKVGKRLLCAKRYGKSGCGRTRPLYLQHIIPKRRYTLSTLLALIYALLKAQTVEQAYAEAVGHSNYSHRQAWRWLSALWRLMPCFRNEIPKPDYSLLETFPHRSQRLSMLLSTLKLWLSQMSDPLSIQRYWQRRFS